MVLMTLYNRPAIVKNKKSLTSSVLNPYRTNVENRVSS